MEKYTLLIYSLQSGFPCKTGSNPFVVPWKRLTQLIRLTQIFIKRFSMYLWNSRCIVKFECIDNQMISKTDAHFGRLKLSKCALAFSVYWYSTCYKIACTRTSIPLRHLSAEDMNCFPVFGILSRHFRSLFRKVNQFTENPRHFPPISLRLPLSICIHSPFLVCFSRESEPVCREFEALSPTVYALCLFFLHFHRESELNFHESVALSPRKFDSRDWVEW